jgi:hypothetical protein
MREFDAVARPSSITMRSTMDARLQPEIVALSEHRLEEGAEALSAGRAAG